MALEGKGRIIEQSKGKLVIYIPAKVHGDSAFPFKPKDDVDILISNNTLVVKKSK